MERRGVTTDPNLGNSVMICNIWYEREATNIVWKQTHWLEAGGSLVWRALHTEYQVKTSGGGGRYHSTTVPQYHSTTVRCVLDWTGLTGVGWGLEVEVNHQKSDIKWYLLIKIWRYNIITLGPGEGQLGKGANKILTISNQLLCPSVWDIRRLFLMRPSR